MKQYYFFNVLLVVALKECYFLVVLVCYNYPSQKYLQSKPYFYFRGPRNQFFPILANKLYGTFCTLNNVLKVTTD